MREPFPMNILIFIAYLVTIPVSNWLIGHVGIECIPNGPCVIPVWPGITAPSGVLTIGAALVLRDAVQETLGKAWAAAAIIAGVVLSALIAPPYLVVASAVAFLVSEGLDFATYTVLRRKGVVAAVLGSGIVGAIVDSAVFLFIAFGSMQFIEGQIIGKLLMTAAASAVLVLRNSMRGQAA